MSAGDFDSDSNSNADGHSDPDWPLLSRLLDEALALPASARAAWLAGLSGEAGALRLRLDTLLRREDEAARRGFLEEPPALGLTDPGNPGPEPAFVHAPEDEIGPWTLTRPLGRGGMAEVWLARRTDGALARPVALKLPLRGEATARMAARLLRERQLLASLSHPNIVRLFDVGNTADGQPWLAMEAVDGMPLTDWCEQHAAPTAQRLRLLLQACDAVQHAHGRLVVHRDIKPSNILVTPDGDVRLLDFGIAKALADEPGGANGAATLTQFSGRPLTPDYASPEQVEGEEPGIATDVYALGVLSYRLLTGHSPYEPERPGRAALEHAILEQPPRPPSTRVTAPALKRALRGDIDTIVLKALKKLPAERYATVDALAADLRRHIAGEVVLARPDSFAYRASRFVRRNRWAVGGGVVVAASLATGLGLALWQARIARVEAGIAVATEGFLLSLFEANSVDGGDPVKAQQTTARQLLETASQRIANSMKEVPEVKLRVLSTLVRLSRDLSLDESVHTLEQQRLALMRHAYPGDSRELATALVDAAAAALASSSAISQGEGLLDEALAMLDRLNEPDSPLRGRLEVTRADQLDADNCEALKHSSLGVPMLRRAPPSDDLFDGLRVLTSNLTYCGDARLALQTGEEALKVTRMLGRRANLWQAYGVIAQAHHALGQPGGYISNARESLLAVRALQPVGGTPRRDELVVVGILARNLVVYGHADEALAVIGDLPERAAADMTNSDLNSVVSILKQQANALAQRGESARAVAVASRAVRLMATYDVSDSQVRQVQRALANAEIEAGNLPAAHLALERADTLAHKLNQAGTVQTNELQGTWIRYWLGAGLPDKASDALARFVVKPSPTGVITRPFVEHAVFTADIALARRDWPAALTAVERAQQALSDFAEPLWARDLALRAALDEVEVRTALGPMAAAQAAAEKAMALSRAMFGEEDGVGHCRTWRVLQRQAAAAGNRAEARALLAKIARWSS